MFDVLWGDIQQGHSELKPWRIGSDLLLRGAQYIYLTLYAGNFNDIVSVRRQLGASPVKDSPNRVMENDPIPRKCHVGCLSDRAVLKQALSLAR